MMMIFSHSSKAHGVVGCLPIGPDPYRPQHCRPSLRLLLTISTPYVTATKHSKTAQRPRTTAPLVACTFTHMRPRLHIAMADSDPFAYAKEQDEYNMQLQHDAVSNLLSETAAATPVRPHTLFSCVGAISQLPSAFRLHFLPSAGSHKVHDSERLHYFHNNQASNSHRRGPVCPTLPCQIGGQAHGFPPEAPTASEECKKSVMLQPPVPCLCLAFRDARSPSHSLTQLHPAFTNRIHDKAVNVLG